MEVILKRTKITSSILKQALRSTESDLKNGKILQVDINRGRALVQRFSEPSQFDQWYDIEELRKY